MKAIDRLKELHLDYMGIRNPNYPRAYMKAYSKKPSDTNGLTNCVTDFLTFSGWHCERTGNEGRTVDDTQIVTDYLGRTKKIGSVKRIPSQATLGTSDLKACIMGKFIAIEIKFGKDRQSDVQKNYEQAVTEAGGEYLIVRTLDDFVIWFDQFIIK